MVSRPSSAVKTAIAAAIIGAADAGSGPAVLRFYTGSMPATPETAVTSQTLLGELTCSDPCATESGGVITFSAITQDSSANATGTAAWARLLTSAGTAVWDFDVTATGGGGAIEMNTTSVVSGGPIAVSSLTITL